MITIQEFASLIPCDKNPLSKYLCRTEFSHIEKVRSAQKLLYKNVSARDITRLRELLNRNIARMN